jgi:hypothetical protein
VIGLVWVISSLVPLRVITVSNESTGKTYNPFLVWESDLLFLQWIHSLEKVKITEIYRVENSSFQLEKTEIEGHVPSPWLDGDFNRIGNIWTANWENKKFDSLRIWVGTVAKQIIYTNRKHVALERWGKPKDLLKIRTMKLMPAFIVLLKDLILFDTK